jgi:predicted ATPase
VIPRINLFGGPGVGKSTLAARLYACLKQGGVNAELVREDVKQWAYEKRPIKPWDCMGVFGRQFDAEQRLLQLGIKPVITDAPLSLNCFYSQVVHKCPAHKELRTICRRFDVTYPTLNFFVHRSTQFSVEGRYQTEEDAIALDQDIEAYIAVLGIKYHDIMSDSESDFNQAFFRILETR